MIKLKSISYYANGEKRQNYHRFYNKKELSYFLDNVKRVIEIESEKIDAFYKQTIKSISGTCMLNTYMIDMPQSMLFMYAKEITEDDMLSVLKDLCEHDGVAFVRAFMRMENDIDDPNDDFLITAYNQYRDDDDMTLLHPLLMKQIGDY